MSAHTPGPWLDLGLESPFGYVIKHNNGKSIAYIAAYDLNDDRAEPYGEWSEEAISNRSLVLAAPELLAALLWIKSQGWAKYAHRFPNQNDDFCDAVDRINAAIAAATGAAT